MSDLIADHFHIRQVFERYCRGCDRMDRALIDSAFWPDSIVDMGPWVGSGSEVSSLLLPIFQNHNAATMHVIAQSNIEVHGDTASGDTYFIGYHRRETGDMVSLMTSFGRYVDRLEKRDDIWRIAKRTVVMEHIQNEDNVTCGDLTMDMFHRGRRANTSDLSYEGRAAPK